MTRMEENLIAALVTVTALLIQSPSALQQTQPSPIEMLAQQTAALGACNMERGALQAMQAKVLGGELQPPAKVVEAVRAAFEKANPGQTFDVEFKVTSK